MKIYATEQQQSDLVDFINKTVPTIITTQEAFDRHTEACTHTIFGESLIHRMIYPMVAGYIKDLLNDYLQYKFLKQKQKKIIKRNNRDQCKWRGTGRKVMKSRLKN